jgi:hypothetical protein
MEAKMAKAAPNVAPEGLAYDVEVECSKVINVISSALDSELLDELHLIYAALEQMRTDLEKLRERAVREQRRAAVA